MSLRLVIGNKNYSTWSMRPWLLLHAFGVDFEEQLVSLKCEGLSERLIEFSDTARVPVLIDGDLSIWDSLAICEYVNDQYLEGRAWPKKTEDRAIARAIVAEMHSGFSAMRSKMPMNCRASRIIEFSQGALNDIARVEDIWQRYARTDEDGNLALFGSFSIADCFFAPVVMRFKCYQPDLRQSTKDYMQAMLERESMQEWLAGAAEESEIIEIDEAGVDRS